MASVGRLAVAASALVLVASASASSLAPRTPLTFVWPTSVEAEPTGSLLVVENGTGRVLRVDPASGRTSAIASARKAYSVARTPGGRILFSAGDGIRRVGASGSSTVVARAGAQIGPVAAARDGDVYFTTATAVYRLAGGTGAPRRLAVGFSSPHGIAVAADGTLLVSDTDNAVVKRIDPATGAVTTFAELGTPRGLAVAGDGTVYAIDATPQRIVHLSSTGRRLGFVGPVFGDAYDLAVGWRGRLYVVDTAAVGTVKRVEPDGTATTLSH